MDPHKPSHNRIRGMSVESNSVIDVLNVSKLSASISDDECLNRGKFLQNVLLVYQSRHLEEKGIFIYSKDCQYLCRCQVGHTVTCYWNRFDFTLAISASGKLVGIIDHICPFPVQIVEGQNNQC